MNEYRVLRNNVTSEIGRHNPNMEENNGNNKRMWRTIQHLLGKRKSQYVNNEDF